MARPQEQLANALQALKALQDQGHVAIRSRDLQRQNRERLLRGGYIERVIKGWYVPTRPDERPGDSTAWYASFWDFCASYLENRFGAKWTLTPEQSVLLHASNSTVPRQLLVTSPQASNNVTELIHGTSIVDVKGTLPAKEELEQADGLRFYKLANALIHCGPRLYTSNPTDMRAALGLLRDASQILPALLEGGHSAVAGRLAGALQTINRSRIADDIVKSMRAAGYTVTETNPFEDDVSVTLAQREHSPYVNRIQGYWEMMREEVIAVFPEPPGIPKDMDSYLKHVDDVYASDAYHSLSIEGYRVTEEMIERVRDGAWNPDDIEADRKQRDAMAARGYWLAFGEVRKSLTQILARENAGNVANKDHGDWYRALFMPSVEAGLLDPSDLAGYRNDQVYIRNSMHVPPKKEAVLDCITALFDQLRADQNPAVRTVLGHWLFGYIHPYMDGNGRMGRFLMNAMLASGGYPWTIITVDTREQYMATLEQASVHRNIKPFAEFLGDFVRNSLKGKSGRARAK